MNLHPLHQFAYCPKCGSPHFGVNDARSKRCARCGFTYYLNAAAATAAFIVNSCGELLVGTRAVEPAKGTLDLPGGFVDPDESVEEGVAREVREETGMEVTRAEYLFSLPNRYVYSGFTVHTADLFFRCRVADEAHFRAMDDAAALHFVPLSEVQPEAFGLLSIRRAVEHALRCGLLLTPLPDAP